MMCDAQTPTNVATTRRNCNGPNAERTHQQIKRNGADGAGGAWRERDATATEPRAEDVRRLACEHHAPWEIRRAQRRNIFCLGAAVGRNAIPRHAHAVVNRRACR